MYLTAFAILKVFWRYTQALLAGEGPFLRPSLARQSASFPLFLFYEMTADTNTQ